MKRIVIMLIVFLFITAAACEPSVPNAKTEAASPGNASQNAESAAENAENPTVLILTHPIVGEYGYIETAYVNHTEFYSDDLMPYRPNIFHIAEKPIDTKQIQENGETVYLIDNEPYICIEKVLTDADAETWPDNYYYHWSYDRRFFYKYGDTLTGGTLYRNLNSDSLEALILDDNTEWQYLLVRADSPLASAQTLRIDDFGLVIIERMLFAKAKDFEVLFYANTRGIDQKKIFPTDEKEDVLKAYGWFYGYNLVFECTRVPGLRYSFFASASADHMKTYINSRAESGRVMINGPTILPIDELQKAKELMGRVSDNG